jgi:lipopolysaccharide transport system permease protein
MKQQLGLVLLFARQELIDRYRDNLLGVAWLVLQPLIYILIFTLIFSDIMKNRLADFDQPYAYSIYLVSGLLAWMMVNNTITRLSSVYQDKSTLIKKVPISLSLMPLYIPLAELVVYLIGMLLFAIVLILIGYSFDYYWLWFPVLFLLNGVFAYAIGLFLALLSPFIPDIRTATPVLLQLFFWMTPIIYLPTLIPESFQWLIDINPFAWLVSNLQNIIFFHTSPKLSYLFSLIVLSGALLGLCRWLQIRLERDIRDLI